MEEIKKAVISLSGGLDSSCLLMTLLAQGKEVRAYSFNYGQKHAVELKKVKKNIKMLQEKGYPVSHQIINVEDIFSGNTSSLVKSTGIDIPKGYYAEDNMKSTVVPLRNVIFSAIVYSKAINWAVECGEKVEITLGLHTGDHCFTGDTKILTPEGLKTIDKLRVGDKVYSFNGDTLKIEEDKCLDVIEKGTNDTIYHITTTTGDIRLTSNHKVYVVERTNFSSKGYDKVFTHKLAGDLKEGDLMITSDTLPDAKAGEDTHKKTGLVKFGDAAITQVTKIEIEHDEEKVYDISIEKNHNFFAGEFGNVLISNSIYPDCRPESQEACRHAFEISDENGDKVVYDAPFQNVDKAGVLKAGVDAMRSLGFEKAEIRKYLKNTHTCYDPNEKGESCGECGSCVERILAFDANRMKDPVRYQKPWKEVLEHARSLDKEYKAEQ